MTTASGEVAVGIDFGTTKSCLAFVQINLLGGERPTPRAIQLYSDGSQFMPSEVYVGADRTVRVGREAYEIARERSDLGGLFTEFKLKMGGPLGPGNQRLGATPVKLAHEVLRALKARAEEGELRAAAPIKRVTVTVPSGWLEEQKSDTKKAAHAAGFEEVNLIREPYAALISLDIDRLLDPEQSRSYVVVDYGGGTCDVAVCRSHPGTLMSSEPQIWDDTLADCGGVQVDRALAEHLTLKARKRWKHSPPETEEYNQELLRRVARDKEDFVQWLKSPMFGHDRFSVPHPSQRDRSEILAIEREEFDTVIKDDVGRVIWPIFGALKKAHLEAEDVDRVFLVGGSSYLPLAKKVVSSIFPQERIVVSNLPRHQVVFGAALSQYYHLKGRPKQRLRRNTTLRLVIKKEGLIQGARDLLGLNRGEQGLDGITLVRAGTLLTDAYKRKRFELLVPKDGLKYVDLKIVEGDESKHVDHPSIQTHVIRRLKFQGEVPARKKIIVEYFINAQDMLELEAHVDGSADRVMIIGPSEYGDTDIEAIRRWSL
jgi:molecular chaperone DnaK (HSP70)